MNKFMKYFVFCLFLISSILSLTACGTAQDKTITIGIVASASSMEPVIKGFKEGMAAKGYIEGENITYIYNGPLGGDAAVLEAEVQGFVDAKVDLILSLATPSAIAAKNISAGSGIPVVFAPISDPVGIGLAASITQPGSNMTGVRSGTFVGKELEWLNRIVPDAKKIFAPYNPKDSAAVFGYNQLTEAAGLLGLEIISPEVSNPDEVPTVLAAMPEDIDAIFMMTDSMILSKISDFVAVAAEKKLPMTSIGLSQVEAGALLAYGPDFVSVGQQCARLADQILKGGDPATIPVEDAEYFLYLNQKTATEIGLKFSEDVLSSAKVIIR